jgi:hypothetical protein
MRIVALSGSLQERSSNAALLGAAQSLAPKDMTVVISDAVSRVPLFNPDLEEPPQPVALDRFRREVGTADAVLIASPEYAHGVPGALKNALDWLVGSGELYAKPVAIIAGSPRERTVASTCAGTSSGPFEPKGRPLCPRPPFGCHDATGTPTWTSTPTFASRSPGCCEISNATSSRPNATDRHSHDRVVSNGRGVTDAPAAGRLADGGRALERRSSPPRDRGWVEIGSEQAARPDTARRRPRP